MTTPATGPAQSPWEPGHRPSLRRPSHITLPPTPTADDDRVQWDDHRRQYAVQYESAGTPRPNTTVNLEENERQRLAKYDGWMTECCMCQDSTNGFCGVACPWILYGKTDWRLREVRHYQDGSDKAWKSFCNFKVCCNCACWGTLLLTLLSSGILLCLPICIMRSTIRGVYGIPGNVGGDVALSILCPCCTVIWNDREVNARQGEKKLRTSRGYKEYYKIQTSPRVEVEMEMEEPLAQPPMAYMSPRQFSGVSTKSHTGYSTTTAHPPPDWDNVHVEVPNQATSGAGSRFHTAVSRELIKYSKPVTNKLQKEEKSQKIGSYRSPDPMIFSPPLEQPSRDDNKRQRSLKRRRAETSVKSGQYFSDSRRPAKKKNTRPDPRGSISPSKRSATATRGLQSEVSGSPDAFQRRKDLHVTIEEVPDSYFNTTPRTSSHASSSDTDAASTIIKVKTPNAKTHRLSCCTLMESQRHESIEVIAHDFADCARIPNIDGRQRQHASKDSEKIIQGANECEADFQPPCMDCPTDSKGDNNGIKETSTLSEHSLENCPLDSSQMFSEKALREGRAFSIKKNNYQHALSECETHTTCLSDRGFAPPVVQHNFEHQREASETMNNEDDFQHSLQSCPPQLIQEEMPVRRRGRYQHTLTNCVEEDPPVTAEVNQHYLQSCSPKVSVQKKDLSYVHDFTECQVDQTILDYYESEENRVKQHRMPECSLDTSDALQTFVAARRRSSGIDLGVYLKRERRRNRMSSCPSIGTEDIQRLRLDRDILQGGSVDESTTPHAPKVPFDAKRQRLDEPAIDRIKNKVLKTKQSFKKLTIQTSQTSEASSHLAASESGSQPFNNGDDQIRNRVSSEMQQVDQPPWVGKLVTSIGKVSQHHGLSAQQSLESLFATQENRSANGPAMQKTGKNTAFRKPRHVKSAEILSTAHGGDDTGQLAKVKSGEEFKGTQPGGIQRLINKMTSFTSMKPMREMQLRPREPRSWRGYSN
ncbi:hypothetical protein BGZ60DRAFT_564381 [Tricladium varicosporioides]|nr:hypothetical protein BGZ60DRAFT_564381 [Hymenoscyphus varicosporioides]